MDRRAMILAATALTGVVVMYVDGLLLQQGVRNWHLLLLLGAGGFAALAVTLIASLRLMCLLGREPAAPG